MIISSTEVQNNFGKYLMMAAKEDIIITKNGNVVARLTTAQGSSKSLSHQVSEKADSYGYGGRKATYEEFLELTEGTDDRYEYIDGEIYYRNDS